MTRCDKPVDMIDVELAPRMEREKACAFSQGEIDDDDREIWIWLPVSQIEVEHGSRGMATVTMPEWLAMKKELI